MCPVWETINCPPIDQKFGLPDLSLSLTNLLAVFGGLKCFEGNVLKDSGIVDRFGPYFRCAGNVVNGDCGFIRKFVALFDRAIPFCG